MLYHVFGKVYQVKICMLYFAKPLRQGVSIEQIALLFLIIIEILINPPDFRVERAQLGMRCGL